MWYENMSSGRRWLVVGSASVSLLSAGYLCFFVLTKALEHQAETDAFENYANKIYANLNKPFKYPPAIIAEASPPSPPSPPFPPSLHVSGDTVETSNALELE